ncbi:hypothetical protein [Synechococcus phage MA10]
MSYDAVNRPSHYAEGRQYEPIAVIEDWELGYHLGNALKYISRAGRKDNITQDLRKAVWYIERHIEALEEKTVEPEPVSRKAGFVDIYQEILNMTREDANTFNLQVPTQDVDDQPLEHWYKWDADDGYMIDPGEDCGWDPNSGPTC